MRIEFADLLEFISKNFEELSSELIPLWHPLGFVSCVVEEVPSSHTVRLHYWPKGERRVKNPDWPIHTHSYVLTSLVLSGQVRDLQYRTIPGSQSWIYSVNYFKGGSEIVRTSEAVELLSKTDEIRISGEQYKVPRGVFHQTEVPIDKSAVTLVVLTDHGVEAPMVLGAKQAEKYPYDRVPFDSNCFWNAIHEALTYHLTKTVNGRS